MFILDLGESSYSGAGFLHLEDKPYIPETVECVFETCHEKAGLRASGQYKIQDREKTYTFESKARLCRQGAATLKVTIEDENLGPLTGFLAVSEDRTLGIVNSQDRTTRISVRFDELTNPGSFRVHGIVVFGDDRAREFSLDFGSPDPDQTKANVVRLEV